MKLLSTLSTFSTAAAAALYYNKNETVGKLNPDTVDELVLDSYVGSWYQMAADKVVYDTFEKDAFCSTALYGVNDDGTISVHNYAKIGAPDGETYTIDGYAYDTNPEEPGQLKVHFDAEEAFPFDAPYWVLSLGPLNSDNLYDWAIVSDNLSAFLFVLARDVDTYNSQYKDEVTALLDDLGFKGRTAPIDTYHGDDCVYE